MLAEHTVGVIGRWANNDHSYAGADDCRIVLFLSAETYYFSCRSLSPAEAAARDAGR